MPPPVEVPSASDASPSTTSGPIPPVSIATRKAPPYPLAIHSSSLSPHSSIPKLNTPSSSSTSPNTRNSLESSRSELDLASVRSDLTSLRCSEFPIPPSGLPPIPASPTTPRSLYFSTTPTTPRSQSPLFGVASQLQDPPSRTGRSLLGSPKSLKGFFTSSRSHSPQPKFTDQQQEQYPTENSLSSCSGPSRSYTDPGSFQTGAYERLPVSNNHSQYATYKTSNVDSNRSLSTTPTTAGAMTPQDWQSSSGRTSPLLPPRPVYAMSNVSTRPPSPLRNTSSAAQPEPDQLDRTGTHDPRSASPRPPKSPLPVPPSRDSLRDSGRYSCIARRAGVTDMGMDISEEQLLSTEFITEMLNQPPSPRFLRLPDSPRSPAFPIFSSDDSQGLSSQNKRSEVRPASEPYLDMSTGGTAPANVIIAEEGHPLTTMDDNPPTFDLVTPGPFEEDGTQDQVITGRLPSGIASSIFPNGGDRVYLGELSPLPISPGSQSLAVPENTTRSHGSPHPFVPSTPMSPESFTAISPAGVSHGFAQAQATFLPPWRKSSTSSTIATMLPIGRPSSGVALGTAAGQATTSPRVGSPRVRQHHYPRTKQGFSQQGRTQDNASLQSSSSPISTVNVSIPSEGSQPHDPVGKNKAESSPAKSVVRSAVLSNTPSAVSNTSSTRTQRDSSMTSPPTIESRHTSSEIPYLPDLHTYRGQRPMSQTQANFRHKYQSDFLSSESMYGDEESASQDVEGEVQTASRVFHTTAPAIALAIDEISTAAGVGPDMKQQRTEQSLDADESQYAHHLDATSPTSGFEPEVYNPPSPRVPPSIQSPPSHRTDIPESARSVLFSEDVHDTKENMHLPYDEVAGYGFPSAFWNVYPGASSDAVPSGRRPSNNAGSFKSFVSYLTTKSKVPTVASKATDHSASSRWTWLKRKPLPPLPPQPLKGQNEANYGQFSPPLQPGQYQRSKISLVHSGEPQGWNDMIHEKRSPPPADRSFEPPRTTFIGSGGKFEMLTDDSLKLAKRKSSRRQQEPSGTSDFGSQALNNVSISQQRPRRATRHFRSLLRGETKKWLWYPLIALVFLIITLSVALGVVLGRKHGSNESNRCSDDSAGVHCNLNATCTCPSPQSGTCAAPLAQALNDLVPLVSQLFVANVTNQALALMLWESQGTPVTSDCASQADLVDVGSVLDVNNSPNRTRWAQAALLWNLFQSGDINATQAMQAAIEKLPFGSLHSKDGIEADPSDKFTVLSLGYTFNLANQTVTPPTLSFKLDASPSSKQLGEINSVTESSLNRMYSFASASSTQRQTALSTYWQSVLLLDPDDLGAFLAAFKSSPILLSFDATASPGGQAISGMLTAAVNHTLSFPPSTGCYPGLSPSQLQRINAVETQAFGLPAITSSPSSFDSSCFANRPVYGTLDVLRTRLPFSDSRSGVAKQAVVLNSDAASRAVLHVGELLGALPAANNTDLFAFDINPRQFGTLSHINHIVLAWLQSFPTHALATEAVKFLLSSPSSPPSSSSPLFNSTSIPIVEAAVFGSVFLTDISSFISSFSTPSDTLFFGSSQGQAFRNWALQSSSATIAWSESMFAAQTVREGFSTNTQFENIWSVAGQQTSNVGTVVNALNGAGLFAN